MVKFFWPTQYDPHLYRVERNAGDWCNTLSHETFVILDGAKSISRVVKNADELLY